MRFHGGRRVPGAFGRQFKGVPVVCNNDRQLRGAPLEGDLDSTGRILGISVADGVGDRLHQGQLHPLEECLAAGKGVHENPPRGAGHRQEIEVRGKPDLEDRRLLPRGKRKRDHSLQPKMIDRRGDRAWV